MIGSFTEVKPLFYWVQHILPLVYDDSLSYMELLGKVTKTLNELVENNNLLPDYIMELIKEYISSGEIEKVLAEVLANYMLNVKFPPKGLTPAVGDGSADDTEAIQGCINYAYQNGGMAVYFPSGSYLTQPLTLNEKVTLFGQDRYTTRIVMKGGATKPLFTGTVDEMSLTGLGFDGNMDIQVNNVNLFTITVNSAIITNCLLTDGYDLLNITVNNELQLDNILFRHAVENALVVGGAGYVQGDNLIFKSLSTLIGKNYVVLNTNKSILEEVKCFGAAPNGVLIGGNSNVVNMWCEACQTPYVDNGTNNTIHVYNVMEDEKFTGNVTQYIGDSLTQTVVAGKTLAAGNVKDTANGTRDESTTGNKTETVNGNDTETVGGDKKETVSGSKSVIVTLSLDENIGTNKISVIKGTNTETITGLSTENANGGKALISTDYNENVINRNITAAKIEETLTGNKTVTAANITETVSGDRTINGGDITHTGDNITTHAKVDLDEQTDGNKVMRVTGTINETTGAKTENVNGAHTETVTGAKTTTAGTVDMTATNGETHRGKRMSILTNDALQYSLPTSNPNETKFFDSIPMIDVNGVGYDLAVYNDNTKTLDGLLENYYANVLDYGADNTGVNDSSAQIQAAVDSDKSVIVFPAGTYYLHSSNVKIPSNKHLIGYGAKIIGDNDATNQRNCFINKSDGITGGHEANENIIIEGFDFSSIMDNVTAFTTVALGHCNNCRIFNCTFHDIPMFHFIEINSSKSIYIDNCYFYNYGSTKGTINEMIQLDVAVNSDTFPWFGPYDEATDDDIHISNCSFIGNDVYSEMAGNFTPYEPSCIGNHYGGDLVHRNIFIENCYAERVGCLVKLLGSQKVNITNNQVYNARGAVFFLNDWNSITVANNIFVGSLYDNNTSSRGVAMLNLGGTHQNARITGNHLRAFNYGVTPQGENVLVSNNNIRQCKCGIRTGYAANFTNILNNEIAGSTQLDILHLPEALNPNEGTTFITGNQCVGEILISNKNEMLPSWVTVTNNSAGSFNVLDYTYVIDINNISNYSYQGVLHETIASKDLTANQWNSIGTIALPKNGNYLVFGAITIVGSIVPEEGMYLTTRGNVNSIPSSSYFAKGDKAYTTLCAFFVSGTVPVTPELQCYPSANVSINSADLWAIRLN